MRYTIKSAYRLDENFPLLGSLKLMEEKLDYIKISDAKKYLSFPHKAGTWRKSVLKGKKHRLLYQQKTTLKAIEL